MDALKLLTAQGGLITRQQALAVGLSSSRVGRAVAAGEWVAMFPGVYRHAATAPEPGVRLNAALLWLGPTAVISGRWAAWWHELREPPRSPVSLTVPRASSSYHHPGAAVRRRDLDPADICEVRGKRVTTRALTALESVRVERGQDVFDRALQRYVSVPELTDAMTRLGGATGVSAARGALGDAQDGTVSPPERELAAELRSAGLTRVQAGVRVVVGRRRFWLDFAVVELRLAVEVDGVVAHTSPAVFSSDRSRQNALVRAGWTVLRYTPFEIRVDPAAVVAEIAATIVSLEIAETSSR